MTCCNRHRLTLRTIALASVLAVCQPAPSLLTAQTRPADPLTTVAPSTSEIADATLVASASALGPASAPVVSPAPIPVPVAHARPPLFNRVNEALPRWLQLRAEFRERVEGFRGAGFTEGRDDAFALTRLRLNATVTVAKHLTFQANLHDARLGGKDVGPTGAPFRGPFDLRTGFADVGHAKAPMTLRVGRQELAFGEQRLIGHLAWVNTGRSFDGVRATIRTPRLTADIFGASLVRNLPERVDRSGNGNVLGGVYASTPGVIPGADVEPFVFVRRSTNLASERQTVGTLMQTTAGVRVAGKLPAGFDYGVEMALQRGALDTDSVSAWAGHWQVRAALPTRGAVKLVSEYNFASGDRDPTDGVRHTFDQLYPTGHDKLGLSDQVGWRNVHHLREGIELVPIKGLPIALSYHTWWLADRADGLYSATGALVARVRGGAASRHVGHEVDLHVSRALTRQVQIAGGYAHLLSGAFLNEATPGASFSTPYVMVTYVFLADK